MNVPWPKIEPEFKTPYLIFIILSFLTCFFSLGHFHPDEHFQVLEYVNAFTNPHLREGLTWEYTQRMRPWFLPIVYHFFSLPLKVVGVKSPFVLAFLFRFISFFISQFAIFYLFKNINLSFDNKKAKQYAYWGLGLTWFIPYFLVRTSSDTLSAFISIFGIALISLRCLDKSNQPLKLREVFLWCFMASVAFLIRYQSLILFGGAWLYLMIYSDFRKWKVILIPFIVLLFISSELIFNYLGYGEFLSSTWNHIYQNIFLGKAKTWGTDPWWSYIVFALKKGAPPLSLALLISTFLYWWKKKKNIWTFSTIPFLVAHLFVSHKELRFLMPIIILSPFFLFSVFDLEFKRIDAFLKNKAFKIFVSLTVVVNFILLFKVIFSPAYSPVSFYQFLAENLKSEEKIYYLDEGRKRATPKLEMNFFNPLKIKLLPLGQRVKNTDLRTWVFTDKYIEHTIVNKLGQCKIVYSSRPDWIFKYNFYNWTKRASVWRLWDCHLN
jgi:GPI mannosyltransferase 3